MSAPRYVATGPGWMGRTEDISVAEDWLRTNNGDGAVYVRLDNGAIEASGRVTVDRARFERLMKPMQLYVQAEGIVVDFTGKGAIAFGKAFEDAVNEIRANPGDLEPLP